MHVNADIGSVRPWPTVQQGQEHRAAMAQFAASCRKLKAAVSVKTLAANDDRRPSLWKLIMAAALCRVPMFQHASAEQQMRSISISTTVT